jgi:uncharacterized protein HemY
LCGTFLRQRLGALQALGRPARLMLTEALLEMGDLRGAYDGMMGLYQQRLSLTEALNLLRLQTEYMARIGAWDAMLEQLPVKMQLVELMSSPHAARTQAWLAEAAKNTGHAELAQWLARRAELLGAAQPSATD